MDITHHYFDTGEAVIHYARAGTGEPVVLLHGWPQTSYCWHKIFGGLASRHTVIAPDLRGYGRSDKPREGYDKRTMATDVSELVRSLGFEQVSVVGHDRGGRVGHRWALDRPEEVARLAVRMFEPESALAEIDLAGDAGIDHPLQGAIDCGDVYKGLLWHDRRMNLFGGDVLAVRLDYLEHL